jgi:hypothetical protein
LKERKSFLGLDQKLPVGLRNYFVGMSGLMSVKETQIVPVVFFEDVRSVFTIK